MTPASPMITPPQARTMASEFLAILPGMEPSVLTGADLETHQCITARAQVLCKQPASAATCREIEACLGILANLWMDAPAFRANPRWQAKTVLDCFEIAGSACHSAAAAAEGRA